MVTSHDITYYQECPPVGRGTPGHRSSRSPGRPGSPRPPDPRRDGQHRAGIPPRQPVQDPPVPGTHFDPGQRTRQDLSPARPLARTPQAPTSTGPPGTRPAPDCPAITGHAPAAGNPASHQSHAPNCVGGVAWCPCGAVAQQPCGLCRECQAVAAGQRKTARTSRPTHGTHTGSARARLFAHVASMLRIIGKGAET